MGARNKKGLELPRRMYLVNLQNREEGYFILKVNRPR
jgi:hypothetical protein